jgi:hypothetical protein
MIKAKRRSALVVAAGLLTGVGTPLHAGPDGLNTPVFVAPAENGVQPNAGAHPSAESQIVAPNQLNDVDRSLHESAATPSSAAVASGEPSPPRSAPVAAANGEHSVWNETSLIGKIFIGFGALLTIASAARMFMA